MEYEYQEIKNLQNLISSHNIRIIKLQILRELTLVKIFLKENTFDIYIQDEYNDLEYNNPLLNVNLVLRELEIYKDSTDFLSWCKTQSVNPDSNELRSYYMKLDNVVIQLESIIGEIDSQISDLDFQLNAGAANELRKQKF